MIFRDVVGCGAGDGRRVDWLRTPAAAASFLFSGELLSLLCAVCVSYEEPVLLGVAFGVAPKTGSRFLEGLTLGPCSFFCVCALTHVLVCVLNSLNLMVRVFCRRIAKIIIIVV